MTGTCLDDVTWHSSVVHLDNSDHQCYRRHQRVHNALIHHQHVHRLNRNKYYHHYYVVSSHTRRARGISSKWRHSRYLESATSYPKSDAVNRCVFARGTITPNFISIRFETTAFLRGRSNKKKHNKNKMSSDMGSVPDTEKYELLNHGFQTQTNVWRFWQKCAA